MIAIDSHLVFLGSFDRFAILAHQSANAAMVDVRAKRLRLFGHSWTTVAAQAETRLLLNVRPEQSCVSAAFDWSDGCDRRGGHVR